MCRFVAYRGPAIPLADLVYDAPHGLERQAFAPRQLVSGHVNVDGTGVAWWREGDPEPLLYRSERPPWSDPNLPALSRRLHATSVLAAIRNATPGIPFGPDHVQPFVFDGIAGTHNGWVEGFSGAVGRDLVGLLSPEAFSSLPAISDSLVVVRLAISEALSRGSLTAGLRAAADQVLAVCERHDVRCGLNLALVDRTTIAAVRTARDVEPSSLWSKASGSARWVASEPLDDAGWDAVAADRVVAVDRDAISLEDL